MTYGQCFAVTVFTGGYRISGDAGQMGWHHLAFALPGVLPGCDVPRREKERTRAPVCDSDHLCW